MSLTCFVTGQFKLDSVSVNSLSEAREDDRMSLRSEGVGVLGSAPHRGAGSRICHDTRCPLSPRSLCARLGTDLSVFLA